MAFKNYYEVLEVSPTATQDEIKGQYHLCRAAWHPDRFRQASEATRKKAEEKFKDIGQAYDVVGNPVKRAAYDRDLRLKEEQEQRRRATEEQKWREENERSQAEPMDAEWEQVNEDDAEENYPRQFHWQHRYTPIQWILWHLTKTVVVILNYYKTKSGSTIGWFHWSLVNRVTGYFRRLEYNKLRRTPVQWVARTAIESAVLLVGFCLSALFITAVLSLFFNFLASFDTIRRFKLGVILSVNVLVLLGLLTRRVVNVVRRKKPFFNRSLKGYALLSVVTGSCYVIALIVSFSIIVFAFYETGYAHDEPNLVALSFFVNLIGLYAFYVGYRAMSSQRRKVTFLRLIAGIGIIFSLLLMGYAVPILFYKPREVERSVTTNADNTNTSTQTLPLNSNYYGNSNYSNSNHSSTNARSFANPTFETLNPTVNHVKFFEAGGKIPLAGDRHYATSFSQSGTRYVYFELSLSHPAPDNKVNYVMNEVWYIDGKIKVRDRSKRYIGEGWNGSNITGSYGCDRGDCWKSGTYQVEFFVGGKKISSGSFEVLP